MQVALHQVAVKPVARAHENKVFATAGSVALGHLAQFGQMLRPAMRLDPVEIDGLMGLQALRHGSVDWQRSGTQHHDADGRRCQLAGRRQLAQSRAGRRNLPWPA